MAPARVVDPAGEKPMARRERHAAQLRGGSPALESGGRHTKLTVRSPPIELQHDGDQGIVVNRVAHQRLKLAHY